ncbi:MAG: UpxY family transcription antiterminator [Acidobacteriia bacterium]|nr:UpxY family transcription antiterminator [Terriglobia bacterium]
MSAQPKPPAPCIAQWYAIQTRYRLERRVTDHLQHKGLETFLPVLEEIHRWSDRRKRVNIPLFSGYTFARCDLSSGLRKELLRTEGVIGLLSFAGEATPVPCKQIQDLQLLLSHQVPCAIHAFLKIGKRVRIRGGCLDGLVGILEQRGEKNLVISLESIRQSVAIKIEGYELEMI